MQCGVSYRQNCSRKKSLLGSKHVAAVLQNTADTQLRLWKKKEKKKRKNIYLKKLHNCTILCNVSVMWPMSKVTMVPVAALFLCQA